MDSGHIIEFTEEEIDRLARLAKALNTNFATLAENVLNQVPIELDRRTRVRKILKRAV